ncbi:hypothetical protein IGB42_03382 [Andreprevotia sp. IGB-42]|uniref:FHA domain-containing protein n=1 Tax=Andreprevotia sp. IGB-42 TaxID=2497473 RepID=UPI0013575EE5|nr:FHA domain-containing protein [Andreprevotia sp. IGB-42]KAF0812105.1 hypothetical protein IGB42_03382 [Andreprevotia sp. IGB-42]
MFIQLITQNAAGSAAKSVALGDAQITIGSAASCTLAIPDTGAISPVHAVIVPHASGWQIRDQGDLLPVLINQRALGAGETHVLRIGDYVKIGASILQVVAEVSADSLIAPSGAPASSPQATPALQPVSLVQQQPATQYATRIAAERLAELGTHRGPSIDPLAMFGSSQAGSANAPAGKPASSSDLDSMFGLAASTQQRPATMPVNNNLDPLALLGGPSNPPAGPASVPEQRQQAASAINIPRARSSDEDALDALFRPPGK